jgi:hypothetical protein
MGCKHTAGIKLSHPISLYWHVIVKNLHQLILLMPETYYAKMANTADFSEA